MGNLALTGTKLQFFMQNRFLWDTWRLNKLKELKPIIIFSALYWKF